MHMTGFVSIALLAVAWRQWRRGEADKGAVHQGILLSIVTAGWFLRIVIGVIE